MTKDAVIQAKSRTDAGKQAMKKLRARGVLPGIVYGDGQPAQPIEMSARDFETLLRHHSSENVMVDLAIDGGEPKRVLLKEVQHEPVRGNLLHVDLHLVSMTRKLHVEIQVELKGTPEGVSQQGGVLEHLLRTVEVACLPGDIVDVFELDVSGLMIGDSLTAADIPLDATKYDLLTPGDIAVAAVAAPRKAEEETAEEAEAAEGAEGAAEPERVGEKDEEEESEKE